VTHAAAVAALLAIPLSSAAGRLQVQHEPLSCVPADRFTRVSASASPAAAVQRADLEFRVAPDAPWYAVPMTTDGAAWSAVLPAPTRALARFEYRVSMAAAGEGPASTAPHAVEVSADAAGCPAPAQPAVSSSIVVRVPPGAPIVPPVPPGFSPTAVVAAQERAPAEKKKTWVVLGGLGAAAAMAGVAAAASHQQETPVDVPTFSFEGTAPAPDSPVSVSRGTLQILVRMSHEPMNPLTLNWQADWRQAAGGPVCILMTGTFNGAQRPTGLVLTGPIGSSGACGTRFTASVAHLFVETGGQVVLDLNTSLPFRFEP
jgi:hypothetical protein